MKSLKPQLKILTYGIKDLHLYYNYYGLDKKRKASNWVTNYYRGGQQQRLKTKKHVINQLLLFAIGTLSLVPQMWATFS